MPTDPRSEPWPDRTYNGFAGPAAEPRERSLPRVRGRALAVGAVIAISLGLVLGFWARPNFGRAPTDAAERTSTPVPIEVNRPPPLAAPAANGKLEVLAPEQASQARAANAAAYPPTVTPAGPTASYVPAAPPPLPSVEAPAYRQVAPPAPAIRQPPPLAAPAEPGVAQVQRQGPARAGFDCSGARSPAEAMVCGDPELAAADREMSRAYRRALQSGSAPAGAVRQDQRDFLDIREDAARHSRRALAQVYRQRIEELNAIADGGDGEGPDN